MNEHTSSQDQHAEDGRDVSRRDFVSMSVAAGVVAASGIVSAQRPVTERNVEVRTPDGTCDAVFTYPTTGTHPGVLIWPDAFGLRQAVRDMAKRLAAEGYAVLAVNPYYRVTKAPGIEVAGFNFANPDSRAKLQPLMGSVNAPGNPEKDAVAFIAWLDQQPQVDKGRKIGTQGYCMGGPLIMRTAAAVPERVGAAASFHGGGLVTANPNSPHLLIPKMKARMYFGVASNDDMQDPKAKDVLKESLAAAKVQGEVELYPKALHGWCMPDMPVQVGQPPIYNRDDAERAWAKLLALYKAGLG
jgi:carboxymethylenebutenolidase